MCRPRSCRSRRTVGGAWPKPPPTPYGRGAGNSVDLPPGHDANVFPLPTSTGFIGQAFSMDSLEFMRWAAKHHDDDRFVLAVLFTLMGSQEPGGLIEATHEDVAKALGYSRPHISRVFHVLERDPGGLTALRPQGRQQRLALSWPDIRPAQR